MNITGQCYLVYRNCSNRRALGSNGSSGSGDTGDSNSAADNDLDNGYYDKHGEFHAYTNVDEPTDAHAACLLEKEKVELALPGLQNVEALTQSCKNLLKDSFGVGCVDMSAIGQLP